MEAWQERLVEEYKQTKERYEKLKAYNNKNEVEGALDPGKPIMSKEERKNDIEKRYRCQLLLEQQHTMGAYLHILELRMELEGISI